MNIKQLLIAQKSLISPLADESSKISASQNYRHWLAESLGKTTSFLIAHDDYELSESELNHYQQGLVKLQKGVPLAYVTGHQPFWQGDFLVNEHTLIPRADTEILIETVLNFFQNSLSKNNLLQRNYTLLDVGTGSGCIAISLAMSLPSQHRQQNWQFTAVDISVEALKIAKQNAVRNGVTVEFLQGNWFSPFAAKQKFDIIVSNPPYIDPQDPHLAALTAEPITALVADNHGLADIFYIIKTAKQHLVNGGLLALEHGYDQAEAVRDYFIQYGFDAVHTKKDYGGNDRVTSGIKLK